MVHDDSFGRVGVFAIIFVASRLFVVLLHVDVFVGCVVV